MNLIILAAGKGSRLGALTKKTPKVLMLINEEKSILDFHLYNAEVCEKIRRTYVVTGFGHKKIKNHLKSIAYEKKTETFFNPFFGISGPLGSIWMLNKALRENFILSNGDTYFSEQMITTLAKQKGNGFFLGVDKKKEFGMDDMKVHIQDGKLVTVQKQLDMNSVSGVSTGMVLVRGKKNRKMFLKVLRNLVSKEENLKNNIPWHQILNELVSQGEMIKTVDLSDFDWQEIDTPHDLKLSTEIVKSSI